MQIVAILITAVLASNLIAVSSAPARLLDLADFALAVPVGPGEILQPQLGLYSSRYFNVNANNTAAVFTTPTDGFIQPGSLFPRTELRQRTRWDAVTGTHRMTLTQAITELPGTFPALIAGQIHDADRYVLAIELQRRKLWVKAGGKQIGVLTEDYQLGNIFTVVLTARDSHIAVEYNGKLVSVLPTSCSGCYFKAGSYVQVATGPGEYGQVEVYSLEIENE